MSKSAISVICSQSSDYTPQVEALRHKEVIKYCWKGHNPFVNLDPGELGGKSPGEFRPSSRPSFPLSPKGWSGADPAAWGLRFPKGKGKSRRWRLRLTQQGIAYQALDKGTLSCQAPQRLQALCDGPSAAKIEALLRKWLRLLPHPFPPATVKPDIAGIGSRKFAWQGGRVSPLPGRMLKIRECPPYPTAAQ